ncbi:endonuclease domain-containing protein [Bifidobacterium simiarum]|uniref:endonuclease domain-containing protein n=1 Tax=Bifidobacterium simiarum TaxID=2045441 RepID=UPI001BDD3E4E|nr:DUF559 domain-containing protein [Bifidobacterium simiarum]MBT1167198.1 DUF559 domain-containing protein [Bifidobacterium simiarum]
MDMSQDMKSGRLSAAPYMKAALAERRRETIRACTEVASRVGTGVLFGMQTALMLQEIPLPDRCDLDDSVLHTVSGSGGKRIRGRGVQAHVWKGYERGAFIRINQYVYALNAMRAWAQLAPHIAFDELVVLANSVIAVLAGRNPGNEGVQERDGVRGHGGVATSAYEELREFLNRRERFTGVRNCRMALRLCHDDVCSPMESRTYLSLMSHGVPVPRINFVVPGMTFRSKVPMTVDLAWPEQKVAVEYDGDQHRTDKAQWRRDQEKRELLRSRGWIVIIVTADDLRDDDARAELAFRVSRYLVKRGAMFDFSVTAVPLIELAKRTPAIR